jgi:hypothetical protein
MEFISNKTNVVSMEEILVDLLNEDFLKGNLDDDAIQEVLDDVSKDSFFNMSEDDIVQIDARVLEDDIVQAEEEVPEDESVQADEILEDSIIFIMQIDGDDSIIFLGRDNFESSFDLPSI